MVVARARASLVLAVGLVVFAGQGCGTGKRLVKVDGVLTWKDGTPISGAMVTFVPEGEGGRDAAGLTGKDGTFNLTTYNAGDGALPGDYKVLVTKGSGAVEQPAVPTEPTDQAKAMKEHDHKRKAHKGSERPEIPTAYGKAGSTPLKWKVESGGPRAELKLEKT